jgi:hypothetical protein
VDAVIPCLPGLMRRGRTSAIRSSSMRFRTWTAIATSVACRSSVCERIALLVSSFPRPAANIGFHQGMPVVPRRFLPTHAAILGNHVQMPVTLCGRRFGRLARHRTRTGWHDEAASEWRAAILPQTPYWSYAPSPMNEAMGPSILSSKEPTCAPSSASFVISAAATTWINDLGGSEPLRSRLRSP